MNASRFSRYAVIPLLLLVILFTGLMLRIALPYFSFETDVDFLLTKQSVLHVDWWRWAFYWHISASVPMLLIGGFQLIPFFIQQYPRLHRLMGKIYVVIVLFISAPSGLIMAFYANGGLWAKTSFVILSLLWWWFTLKAYLEIRKRNIAAHRAFMIRSYALTLSAIALRLYVLLLPYFISMHGREMYVLVAWLSWIPNLLMAEWLITRRSAVLQQQDVQPKN